jgi:hypothetical protein
LIKTWGTSLGTDPLRKNKGREGSPKLSVCTICLIYPQETTAHIHTLSFDQVSAALSFASLMIFRFVYFWLWHLLSKIRLETLDSMIVQKSHLPHKLVSFDLIKGSGTLLVMFSALHASIDRSTGRKRRL